MDIKPQHLQYRQNLKDFRYYDNVPNVYFGPCRVSNCHIYVLLSQTPLLLGIIMHRPARKALKVNYNIGQELMDQVILLFEVIK